MICCQVEAPSIRAASSDDLGRDCSAASDSIKMNGVHCQMSAMITDGKAQSGEESQGMDSKPHFFNVLLMIPNCGLYI